MKIFTPTLLLAFLIISLSSCERDADFLVPDGGSKLFVFSEISTEDRIEVKVYQSIGVNTSDEFYFPKQGEAKITLYENGVALSNPGFRYIASKKAFVSQGSFRATEENEYAISVELVERAGIKDIYASTVIPQKIEDFNATNALDIVTGVVVSSIASLDSDSYQRINAIGIDLNGEEHEMIITQIMRQNPVSIGPQMLLNTEGGESTELHLSSDEIDLSSLVSIKYIVENITEDAYEYHRAYQKMFNATGAVIAEPVISYSNVENGLGLFSGYSRTEFVFPIN